MHCCPAPALDPTALPHRATPCARSATTPWAWRLRLATRWRVRLAGAGAGLLPYSCLAPTGAAGLLAHALPCHCRTLPGCADLDLIEDVGNIWCAACRAATARLVRAAWSSRRCPAAESASLPAHGSTPSCLSGAPSCAGTTCRWRASGRRWTPSEGAGGKLEWRRLALPTAPCHPPAPPTRHPSCPTAQARHAHCEYWGRFDSLDGWGACRAGQGAGPPGGACRGRWHQRSSAAGRPPRRPRPPLPQILKSTYHRVRAPKAGDPTVSAGAGGGQGRGAESCNCAAQPAAAHPLPTPRPPPRILSFRESATAFPTSSTLW